NRLNGKRLVLSPTDQELMDSLAGRVVTAIINERTVDAAVIHPMLSLEIDLRLDSLARVECLASIEQTLGVQFKANEMTSVFTVGELVKLASRKTNIRGTSTSAFKPGKGKETAKASPKKPHWRQVLTDTSTNISEVQP